MEESPQEGIEVEIEDSAVGLLGIATPEESSDPRGATARAPVIQGAQAGGKRTPKSPLDNLSDVVFQLEHNIIAFRKEIIEILKSDRRQNNLEFDHLRGLIEQQDFALRRQPPPPPLIPPMIPQAVPPVAPPMAAWAPKLKMEYSGDPGELEAFLWHVRGFIQANQARLQDEDTRVRVLVDQLRGAAAKWAVAALTAGGPVVATFDAFVDALRRQFADPARRDKAVESLRALKQGSLSVADYVLQFKQLLAEIPDWTEEMKIREFTDGLNREVYKMSATRSEPLTLDEWVELATRMDLLQTKLKARDSKLDTKKKTTKPKRESAPGTATGRPNWFQTGKCFRCGGEGHRVADCPTPDLRKEEIKVPKTAPPPAKVKPLKKKKAAAQTEVADENPDLPETAESDCSESEN